MKKNLRMMNSKWKDYNNKTKNSFYSMARLFNRGVLKDIKKVMKRL